MKFQSLLRYPVKSLQGESLNEVQINQRGISGDRRYALLAANGKLGSGKSTRRFQKIDRLLSLGAFSDNGTVVVRLPDETVLGIDDTHLPDRLSEHLGQPIKIIPETQVPHFDDGAVHIILTSELRTLQNQMPDTQIDARRFRPNLVIECPDGVTADTLIGRVLTIGETRLKITHPTERCVMVTMEQDQLPHSPQILKRISQMNDLNFGVYASVLKSGSVRVGQTVEVSAEISGEPQGGFGV